MIVKEWRYYFCGDENSFTFDAKEISKPTYNLLIVLESLGISVDDSGTGVYALDDDWYHLP